MRASSTLRIRFEARLVEDAVLAAEGRMHPLQRLRFREARNRLYTRQGDDEEREAAFERFHREWFERLGLASPLFDTIGRYRHVHERLRHALVLRATRSAEEEADLRDPQRPRGPATPVLMLRVRPETVADGPRFRAFLDHELCHVDDMLDPAFAYDRSADFGGSPAARRQMHERFRILWDLTIDGRLVREGRLPGEIEARRLEEFRRLFPELGPRVEEAFARWFRGRRPDQATLMEAAAGAAPLARSAVCPLCRFPYVRLEGGALLTHEALRAIRADFPEWTPDAGVCIQCADLYRARARAGS